MGKGYVWGIVMVMVAVRDRARLEMRVSVSLRESLALGFLHASVFTGLVRKEVSE